MIADLENLWTAFQIFGVAWIAWGAVKFIARCISPALAERHNRQLEQEHRRLERENNQ